VKQRADPIISVLESFLFTYFFPYNIIAYMTKPTKKTPTKKKSIAKKKKSIATIKREAKEELFCQRFATHFNGTKAAIEAKYAKSGAHTTASNLLKKTEIIARIGKLTKRTTDKLELTRDMVTREIAKIGFSNIKSFIDDDGNIRSLKDVSDDETAAISSLEVESLLSKKGLLKGYSKKMKMHSKIEALKLLDNYFKEDEGEETPDKPDDKFL
jgi:phage terminase small subunit